MEPCLICKKNWMDCPHSHEDIRKYKESNKLAKQVNKLVDARLKKHGLLPEK